MRTILATLIGVLMVWMQAVASVSPHLIEQTVACQCCRCGNPGCATQNSVPAPAPAPATNCSISEKEKTSPPMPAAKVALAPAVAADALRVPVDACPPPALPLFRRHCVLLL